jgi:LacI family transcriptional regulator
MQATSHDVAALAGVSQPTVSRALRGDPRVAPATRARVQAAAAQLGYVPSERGRSLSTRRTSRVGVVVEDLSNPFYLELLDELHRELDARAVRMVVLTDAERAEPLLDGSLDGAVLTTTLLDATLPFALQRRGFPFVLLNREPAGIEADACVADNEAGAHRIGAELAALGHRRIAALLGPANTSTGRAREAGFRRALAEAGVELPDARVRRGPFSFASGHRGLSELAGERPTAVFCANDVVALGALNAARGLGLGVPEQLSVVGFDDIAMAAWELFRLTTARQDVRAMCRTAARLLLARIEEPERPPERVVLPAALVPRGTHAAAPAQIRSA